MRISIVVLFATAFSAIFSDRSSAQPAPADTTQKIAAGRTNSAAQEQKPYVILISADGFRYDLADKYHATHLSFRHLPQSL